MKHILIIVGAVIFLSSFYLSNKNSTVPVLSPTPFPTSFGYIQQDKDIPVADAKNRITKKMFALFISPQNSPVSPEKFTGYHTGTDFEIFSGEENKDVSVYALCGGRLVLKKYATGYGGVVVQECTLDNQEITVIYGHLKLASIVSVEGAVLKRGDMLGILGKGYSTETDGERKHLHLGIHKGVIVNILGYVQKSSELSSWLDPAKFLLW